MSCTSLFSFLVGSVRAAEAAIFLELQLVGRAFLIFRGCIVFPLALGASQADYISHKNASGFRHPMIREASLDVLLNNFRDNSGADRPATFPDCESKFLFHCYRRYQLPLKGNIVSGHYHLHTFRKRYHACNIRGTEVKLGPGIH